MNDAHGDFACVGDELEGVYRVRREGTLLTLTKVRDDSCQDGRSFSRPRHLLSE